MDKDSDAGLIHSGRKRCREARGLNAFVDNAIIVIIERKGNAL